MARNKKTKKALKNVAKSVAHLALREAKKPGALPKVGRALGGLVGRPNAGMRAGQLLGTLLGHGDYQLRANSLIKGGHASGLQFDSRGRRGVRIVESEYLTDIQGTTSWLNTAYAINPGLAVSFPWLSSIANQYDEYQINGLVYEFRSTSAAWNGSSQALGTVVLSCDYDSLDSNYASKLEAESSFGAVSTSPDKSVLFGVECAPKETALRTYYTRPAAIPTGAFIGSYDLGKFQIGTTGFVNTPVVGELWVHYDVTFFKKQMLGGQIGGTVFNNFSFGAAAGASGSNMFASITAQTGNLYVTLGTNVITFPSFIATGSYTILMNWTGSLNGCTGGTMTYSGCQLILDATGGPSSQWASDGSSTTTFTYHLTVQITAPGASITFSGFTLPLTITNTRLYISQRTGLNPYSTITSN